MRLRAAAPDHPRTWQVTAPPTATIGELATALGLAPAARYALDDRLVAAGATIQATGVPDGALLALPPEPDPGGPRPAATDGPMTGPFRLIAVTGPRAGSSWALGPGRHSIGRHPAMAILLDDDSVAAFHGELEVGRHGDVVLHPRDGSAPVAVAGPRHAGAGIGQGGPWTAGEVRIGAATFAVTIDRPGPPVAPPPPRAAASTRPTPSGAPDTPAAPIAPVRNRPPRAHVAPLPPPPAAPADPPEPSRTATARTLVTMLVPSLATVALAAAVRPEMLALAALAPVGALVTWSVLALLDRLAARRRHRAIAQAALDHAVAVAAHARVRRDHLVARHPDPAEVAARITAADARLWERRPRHDDFLRLAPGLGRAPAPLDADVHEAGAPIEIDLRAPVGLVGPEARTTALARALVIQLAAHHGPADLRIVAWTTDPLSWRWLAWLPHVPSTAGVVDDPADEPGPRPGASCRTLLVVDAGGLPAAWRDAWRHVIEPAPGATATPPIAATAIVLAADPHALPEQCRTVIDVRDGTAIVRCVDDGSTHELVAPWLVDHDRAEDLAARLAPWRDPDVSSDHDVPERVGILDLVAPTGPLDEASVREAVLARWAASQAGGAFAAPLGVDAHGPLTVDLVADGPHGLIAGTTGSGKSELLRALVLSFAASHDAEHVAFVLVDYKGGSAFDGLHRLPHVVDVVTDLDAASATRAVHGLEAEVLRRERVLRDAGASDIAAYHELARHGHGHRPLPRLMIVVDEFATLASELPSFVDALVDVAQRGRSLGVHLVLATQRPSGAVKDTIRTNTNLRIALRVLDAADSRDVLGVDDAAHIGRARRGRALMRLGAGELRAFQSAYAGGPAVRAASDAIVATPAGLPPTAAASAGAPSELERLVAAVVDAHRVSALVTPTRPWADALPADLHLDALRARAGEGSADALVIGLRDDVEAQAHVPYAWPPAAGHLLVAGLAGSGVTDALLACIAAAAGALGDRPDVYVIANALARYEPLTGLARVGAVIATADGERVARLVRMMTSRIETARRLGRADRRTLIVVDGVATLRASFDNVAGFEVLDAFDRAVADGPAAGVHFAFGADHPAALGHKLDRTVAQRVLLRLADRADYATVGVRDIDPAAMVPRRGVDAATGCAVQIAEVRDGDLASSAATDDARPPAAPVGSLPEVVVAGDLPAAFVDAALAVHLPLGIGDDDLALVGLVLHPGDHATVIGGPRAGKSTVLATIVRSLRAATAGDRAADVVVIAGPRSPLTGAAVARADIEYLVERLLVCTAPTVVVVDDADAVDDGGALDRLVAHAPPCVHVVAAARGDRLRPLFRHWTAEVRRSGHAVLLRADDGDGDLVGVRLPRVRAGGPPGRGWLACDGVLERVQCAIAAEVNDRGDAPVMP